MTKIINLYGGPGSGKSTTAAELFATLKKQGKSVELVTEFPKELVWDESYKVMHDQIYILGEHWHRIWRLLDKVDYIVSDSPLLLSLHYGKLMKPAVRSFDQIIVDAYHSLDNIDIFLARYHFYDTRGRVHNEEQANVVDESIRDILELLGIDFHSVLIGTNTITKILDIIEEHNAH